MHIVISLVAVLFAEAITTMLFNFAASPCRHHFTYAKAAFIGSPVSALPIRQVSFSMTSAVPQVKKVQLAYRQQQCMAYNE